MNKLNTIISFLVSLFILAFTSCNDKETGLIRLEPDQNDNTAVKIEAESFNNSNTDIEIIEDLGTTYISAKSAGWISLDFNMAIAGRYQTQIKVSSNTNEEVICWVEDYYDNTAERICNISGDLKVNDTSSGLRLISKDGCPLNEGLHKMKLHFNGPVHIDWVKFVLLKEYQKTPLVMVQKTEGEYWEKVWSDEFEGSSIDLSKWSFDVGDWGWGNGENQYYTDNKTENARLEEGKLVIEAIREGNIDEWSSARITTREKVSFLYGKIEIRAMLPPGKGNWAAGWTLGDEYIDELSWPYCGEIDIFQSVGYEMNDETGKGIAHASAQNAAYYFKLGNQPTNTVEVKNMSQKFHTYSVEWTPVDIKFYVDDLLYLTYDDNQSSLSWPFAKPQNIVLNLAVGGGWGGYYGIDENIKSQKMIVDYVRVFEKR